MGDDLKPCRQRFCGAVSVGPPVECGAKAGQPCQRPDLQPSDAATITQLRADLAAANERAEKAETTMHGQAWDRITAEADAAALRALMPEVLAALDATGCNVSLARDVRAALAPSAPDEGAK